MPVSPARAAAFDILLRVERESSYASELLHSKAYENLSTPDHALATELVMGALRWQSVLDSRICNASSQPIAKLDLEVLIALRLAVYQFGWLTRIPVRAALHESVELVKRARKRSAAPFVNAVLRTLAQEPLCPVVVSDSALAVAEASAHPLRLVERWMKHYGPGTTAKICAHNQEVPQTSIRVRDPAAEAALAAEGISLAHGNLLSWARTVRSGDVTKTDSFRRGDVVIQDEGSQLIAALVGPGRRNILDCCAAPGGKTLAIADQNPGASITAVEIHPHRTRLLQKLFHEETPRIRIVTADARDLPFTDQFDTILADVPCSGTGTLDRNPEIKWRLQPTDLRGLHDRQLAILRSTVKHLTAGGRLVYSTCSLEREENEDVIEQTLKDDASIRLLDCGQELDGLKKSGVLTWPDTPSLTSGSYLRTIPGKHPCDGFFAAILQRT